MSDTAFVTPNLQPQNDPNTNVRVATVTMSGNLPPARVKRAVLMVSNAQIAAAGILWIMLGNCALPFYINAPAALTVTIPIFDSDCGEFLELSDFSLSQPLTGGVIALLTVQ